MFVIRTRQASDNKSVYCHILRSNILTESNTVSISYQVEINSRLHNIEEKVIIFSAYIH